MPLLKRFLVIGLVFYDESCSDSLRFYKENGVIKFEPIKKKYKKLWWSLITLNMFRYSPFTKLLPIPLIRINGKPGESYHAGSLQNGIIDKCGRFISIPQIGVIGAAALHSLEPGPITKSAMLQAIKLAEKF